MFAEKLCVGFSTTCKTGMGETAAFATSWTAGGLITLLTLPGVLGLDSQAQLFLWFMKVWDAEKHPGVQQTCLPRLQSFCWSCFSKCCSL